MPKARPPAPDDEPRPRYRPKYDPRRDDAESGEYGVADAAPGGRPPRDEDPPDDDDRPDDEEFDEEEEERRRRKRKKRRRKQREAGFGEVDEKYRGRNSILDRPDTHAEDNKYEWALAAGMGGVGALVNLAVVVIMALAAGKAAAVAAIVVGIILAVMIVGEVIIVTTAMVVTGQLAGIDFGPVKTAFPKLAAVVVFTNGVVLLLFLLCGIFTLLLVPIIGIAAFQTMFRLPTTEMMISLAVLGLVSLLGNVALFAVIGALANG